MRAFRNYLVLSCAALGLAACGGDTQPQTVGSVAPPGGGSTVTPAATPGPAPASTPTPTGSAGNGLGVYAAGTTPATPGYTPNTNHFLAVTETTTYNAIGSLHTLNVASTGGTRYEGNASLVQTPSGTVNYNPRDGIFTITLNDTLAGFNNTSVRYQDPAHRTDFNPNSHPYREVPNLDGFNYLDALTNAQGTPPTTSTFFYQRPGNATTYVSLAGFVRSDTTTTNSEKQRGVFVFGSATPQLQIPRSGSADYSGGFLATMVTNPTFDANSPLRSILQWMNGNASINVNFATGGVTLDFAGRVGETYEYNNLIAGAELTTPTNTTFFARGAATIDLVRSGGFRGEFSQACFVARCGEAGAVPVDFARVSPTSSTAGASSIDGTFFGPNAVNLGGNFRIVGGMPDQRVDILGAFTGAKK